MDRFTIIIKLTGLLLITPSTPRGGLPIHVLMPVPHAGDHVAQIGYRGERGDCPDPARNFDDHLGICYRDMDGWIMDIGRGLNSSPDSVRLPGGLANVSNASHRSVDSQFFSEAPDPSRLRSRVTLWAGRPVDSCKLAWWTFHNSLVTLLTNVLTWEIPDAGEGTLSLKRRRFGGSNDEDLVTLTPINGIIELFIRQVPPEEELHYMSLRATQARNPVAAGARASTFSRGTTATHFHAYYDLLGIPADGDRPLPHKILSHERSCTWAQSLDRQISGELNPLSPGTASCMMALGLPQ